MSAKTRLTGTVKSNKTDKTAIIEVTRKVSHPKYGKIMVRKKKFYAHTVKPIEVGTVVTIEEAKPISKLKRWRIVDTKKEKSK